MIRAESRSSYYASSPGPARRLGVTAGHQVSPWHAGKSAASGPGPGARPGPGVLGTVTRAGKPESGAFKLNPARSNHRNGDVRFSARDRDSVPAN